MELLQVLKKVDADIAVLLGASPIYREGVGSSTHFRFTAIPPPTAAQIQVTQSHINKGLRAAYGAFRVQLLLNNATAPTQEARPSPPAPSTTSFNRFAVLEDASMPTDACPTNADCSVRRPTTQAAAQAKKQQKSAKPLAARRRAGPGLRVATLNMRGGLANKQEDLAAFLSTLASSQPDLIAIQDHGEHEGDKEIAAELGGMYTYFGRKQPKGSEKGGGAGWYVHNALCHAIKLTDQVKLKLTHPQSQWITLSGGSGVRDLHLASVYMPTESKHKVEREKAWAQLADDTLKMKDKGEVVLLGDFNARVGSAAGPGGVIGEYGELNAQDRVPNKNGKLMLSFLDRMELTALGNRTASALPMYTFSAPTQGWKTIIDYILVDSKLFSCSNMPALHIIDPPFDLTDHSMLYVKLDRQAFRRPAQPTPVSLRWKLDKLDVEETRTAYQKALEEQVPIIMSQINKAREELSLKIKDTSLSQAECTAAAQLQVSAVAEALEAAIIVAAEKHIGCKRVRQGKSKPYWDAEVKAAWRKMHRLWGEYKAVLKKDGEGEAATSKFKEYTQQRSTKKALIKVKKTTRSVQLAERLNATMAEHSTLKTPAGARELWAQVKRHTKSEPAARISAIRDGAGALQHSAVGKANALGQFYKQLLDVPTYEQDPAFRKYAAFHAEVQSKVATYPGASQDLENQGGEELGQDISTEEVAAVLKSLAHRKAGSPNSRLVNELLKYSGEGGCVMITGLLSLMWQFECKPNAMKVGYVVSIFKKGHTEDPGNYRPLSMLHCLGKVYSKLINRRIMQECEDNDILHEAQNGFRRDRRCEDHLITLKEVLAGRMRAGESTYLYATDVYKAYDCVWRDGLFFRLWQAGIRGRMWRVLREMYQGTKSVATYEGQESSEGAYDVKMGLAQGDPLSPTLFAIFINPLLQTIEDKCAGVPLGDSGSDVHSLLFADDQLGLSTSQEETDILVDAVDDHCAQWKVKLNKKKGWVMVMGPDHQSFANVTHWGTTETPIVNTAVYLGGTIDAKLQRDTHAKAQLKKAETKIGMLTRFLNSRRIHVGLRQLVLDMLVKPTLEMGTAVFAPTKRTAENMQSAYTNAQKMVVGAHTNTNGTIVGLEMGSRTLNSWRTQQQLHIGKRLHDMQTERLTKKAQQASWPKARNGPRPLRWMDVQKKALKEVGAA